MFDAILTASEGRTEAAIRAARESEDTLGDEDERDYVDGGVHLNP
jgi:hypothetical protein